MIDGNAIVSIAFIAAGWFLHRGKAWDHWGLSHHVSIAFMRRGGSYIAARLGIIGVYLIMFQSPSCGGVVPTIRLTLP